MGGKKVAKIFWRGFTPYRWKANPVVRAESFQDGTIDHMQNFFDCVKTRKEPNAPVETGSLRGWTCC